MERDEQKSIPWIEIIIALAVVGVLAGLLLPRITEKVEASRLTQAVNALSAIRRAAVNCFETSAKWAECHTEEQIGVDVSAPPVLFSYWISACDDKEPYCVWYARRVGQTWWIAMSIDNDGVVTFNVDPRSPYAGITAWMGAERVDPSIPAYSVASTNSYWDPSDEDSPDP